MIGQNMSRQEKPDSGNHGKTVSQASPIVENESLGGKLSEAQCHTIIKYAEWSPHLSERFSSTGAKGKGKRLRSTNWMDSLIVSKWQFTVQREMKNRKFHE